MNGLQIILAGAASAYLTASAPQPSLEVQILDQMNGVRSDPRSFDRTLKDYRNHFQGKVAYAPGEEGGELTQEGPAAVDEARRFLTMAASAQPLRWDDALARMAAEHAADQSVTGGVGHDASDGADFSERVERHVRGRSVVSEIISYGEANHVDVVRQFIVDDGEPRRAHRTDLFESDIRRAGVACRPHPVYTVSCVVELSSD